MNIDLDGKAVLVGGAKGPLTATIETALRENGATVMDIAGRAAGGNQSPFALVLVSEGANGLPDSDSGNPGEANHFVAAIRSYGLDMKRAVIVFSAAGLVPVKGYAQFSAEQAGLASLTRTLAMELGPKTVINGVAVGAYEAGGDVRTARFLTHTGVKRAATPDEILAAVLFLADPDNGYMTGHTLAVDGGWAVGYARNF